MTETTETNETLPSPKKMLGIASRFAAFDHALNINEVADELGVNKKTIERMARAGRIPSFKIGNQVRFDPRHLAEWKPAGSRFPIPSVLFPSPAGQL